MNQQEAVRYAKNPSNRNIVATLGLLVASLLFFILSCAFDFTTSPEESTIAGVQDSETANDFSKIQMAMRIMPSQNTEGNMLVMVEMNGTAEHEAEYSSDFADDVTHDFFTTDRLEDYFPDLLVDENTVPVGNAKPFCLHLDWTTKAHKRAMDKYFNVQDQPECKLAQNPKVRWQASDPRNGLDFPLWKQYTHKAAAAEDCEPDSVFVASKTQPLGTCFRYEHVEAVCVAV